MFQDYYPERLSQMHILGINAFFRMVFTLLKPFMSKRTTDKIHFLENKEELKKYFDED